ncbi:MAG: hypothetical protein SOU13_00215 [Eubacteriales bacterium]|nr:hypothetical protein [Eubacteriales bacterium]
MLKRLNGSWYLTDGILTPVRLDAPACVGDALRGAGILTDGESAADLLKNEWIYRREWRYSLSPEGGFPADGRAYLSLFGLRGEWTALLDGRELARGDDTEAEIALPAGEPGATLTIAFAVPAAAPLWPRVGLDGSCLLRTVGSAAITSLSLNVPDDAPWTARTAVRAEAAGACDLRYVLEIGGERTETIVRETLAPGENFFEHTIHEPARPAACAPSAASPERAATCSSGATSPERAATCSSGATSPERAATFASGAASPERVATCASSAASPECAAAVASGAASPERAAACASGAASPERAATFASGTASPERAATFASGAAPSERAATCASGTAPSERAATFASAATSPERAATFASGAASPERSATFASGAAPSERAATFASGTASPERAATFVSGAASPECAATGASGAASPERAATFAPGAASPERAATFAPDAASPERAATFASGAAPSERAAASASGAALSERAAASSSGAASPERAGTPASSVAAANSSVRTMSETKTSTGRGFFARILHKNERSAATANPSARSTPENDRAAVLASGANFLERFSTGADSAARAASPVPGAASSGRFSTDADSPARGAANSDSAARTTTENRYAATFAPGADSSTSGAMNSDSAARAATPASGENFLERFSADADSAARAANPTSNENFLERFSADAGFSDYAAADNGRAAAFASGATSSERAAASTDSAARAATPSSGKNFLERFSADADSAARVNGVDSAAYPANRTSNENFLEHFSADADFSNYAAAGNGRAAAFASGATFSERTAVSTDSAARAANPTSNENFLERFSADADSAARVNGVDSAARAANPTSNENFLEHFSADADFSDYAAADNGRAAADTGFSARAATENGRAAAFVNGAASSERTAANAGFSARAATDNGRAAAFVNGATFSERAAVLANGADSATRAAVTVSLRAEILSGGVVSDSRDARLYIPADETAPRGFAGADAVSAALAAEIGANALCAPDASRARMAAAEHELAFIPYHSLAIQRAARACQRYEALLRLAGNESRVLDPALWRLTGCDMDAPELSSLLSSDGDFEEVCRRSRYRQAIALRDAAEHARMKRVPFLLDGAKDDAPTCLSGALFDLDGAARPAYFALADAWKAEHAFVLPPESFPADGIVSVPVFYLSDEKTPPCTVNVRAYSMDGQELITAGFPVPGRATDVIGRLCVEMPEDGLLLLRASVLRDGACVSRSDRLITLNEACLSALRPVQLLPDAATLRNASNTVAVGVSVPAAHYFGALLPGETLPLDEPRLPGFEALNPLL